MPHRRHPARDRAIGARIALARTLAGLSRGALGERLAVGADQVLRYERGTTPVAAWRLQDLAVALGRAPAWFVETDHAAVAHAACFGMPGGKVLRREFERAVATLSPGGDRRSGKRRGAAHAG